MSRRKPSKRKSEEGHQAPPGYTIHCFARQDIAAQRSSFPGATWSWLPAQGSPEVGQWVSVQIVLDAPLPTPAGAQAWCVLSGWVTEIHAENQLTFVGHASSDQAPMAFQAVPWRGRLERIGGLEHPWFLVALAPASQGEWDAAWAGKIGNGNQPLGEIIMPLMIEGAGI